MRSTYVVVMSLGFALVLSGCGKGVDARLATSDENAYRMSLNTAWKEMNQAQQDAFNWAVSDLTLQQLMAKHPQMTPRSVIEQESDEYIQQQTKLAAAKSAELAENAERLAREEKLVSEVNAELDKITVNTAGIYKNRGAWRDRTELVFVTKNDSKFDLSSATWDAWLFINDEATSDRHCSMTAYYKTDGGLAHGQSMKYSRDLDLGDCRSAWGTLEVQKAKTMSFKFELAKGSVKNYGEKTILPSFSPTRADYESAIKRANANIEGARKHRASLQ